MNTKTSLSPISYLGNCLKSICLKLFQDPAYHNIKQQSKYRGRDRNKGQI